MAGVQGFEPWHRGFKVPRLTAWLYPNEQRHRYLWIFTYLQYRKRPTATVVFVETYSFPVFNHVQCFDALVFSRPTLPCCGSKVVFVNDGLIQKKLTIQDVSLKNRQLATNRVILSTFSLGVNLRGILTIVSSFSNGPSGRNRTFVLALGVLCSIR